MPARALRAELRLALSLWALPGPVRRFYCRARRRALRASDAFSLDSAARPRELAALLRLAHGHETVVELGTGTAWTAIALALDDDRRTVISYDPHVRPQRDAYLQLAGGRAGERIDLREETDSAGPHPDDAPVEVLFIDSSHECQPTVAAFGAWREALAARAVVVFHDYGHPSYPGVREAVEHLGLIGEELGGAFVWRAP